MVMVINEIMFLGNMFFSEVDETKKLFVMALSVYVNLSHLSFTD